MAQHQIDRLDQKILQMISKNARIPILEIARTCNVSSAAIHQRIQKLRKSGVIKGSEFIVDTYKIGYQTCAYIGITLKDVRLLKTVAEELKKIQEVVECHYTTGKFDVFIKIYAQDNKHLLNLLIEKISLIEGVDRAETFQISLNEIFHRQLSEFKIDDEKKTKNEKEENED